MGEFWRHRGCQRVIFMWSHLWDSAEPPLQNIPIASASGQHLHSCRTRIPTLFRSSHRGGPACQSLFRRLERPSKHSCPVSGYSPEVFCLPNCLHLQNRSVICRSPRAASSVAASALCCQPTSQPLCTLCLRLWIRGWLLVAPCHPSDGHLALGPPSPFSGGPQDAVVV